MVDTLKASDILILESGYILIKKPVLRYRQRKNGSRFSVTLNDYSCLGKRVFLLYNETGFIK